jgi:hypothetical protein
MPPAAPAAGRARCTGRARSGGPGCGSRPPALGLPSAARAGAPTCPPARQLGASARGSSGTLPGPPRSARRLLGHPGYGCPGGARAGDSRPLAAAPEGAAPPPERPLPGSQPWLHPLVAPGAARAAARMPCPRSTHGAAASPFSSSRSTVRACSSSTLRRRLSVAPPCGLGVPHEPCRRRAY